MELCVSATAQGAAPEPTDLYGLLGLEPKASIDDVRRAWKRTAHKLHPDKGGSKEAWERARYAYDVLSDETMKALYDHHQVVMSPAEVKEGARQMFANLVDQFIGELAKAAPKTLDLVEPLCDTLHTEEERSQRACKGLRSQIENLKKNLARIKRKKGTTSSILHIAALHRIKMMEQEHRNHLMRQCVIAEAIKLALEYECEVEEAPKSAPWVTSTWV